MSAMTAERDVGFTGSSARRRRSLVEQLLHVFELKGALVALAGFDEPGRGGIRPELAAQHNQLLDWRLAIGGRGRLDVAQHEIVPGPGAILRAPDRLGEADRVGADYRVQEDMDRDVV